MRVGILIAALLGAGLAACEGEAPIEDPPDTFALPGDPGSERLRAGKAAYEPCASCHHADGGGRPDGSIPRLAGQLPEILERQLGDLRAIDGMLPTMTPFARALSPAEVRDVARYLGSLPDPAEIGHGDGTALERGREVYDETCAACHGTGAGGQDLLNAPALRGQHAGYLVRRLDELAAGARPEDDPAMAALAAELDPADRLAVADHLSRLPGGPTLARRR